MGIYVRLREVARQGHAEKSRQLNYSAEQHK